MHVVSRVALNPEFRNDKIEKEVKKGGGSLK